MYECVCVLAHLTRSAFSWTYKAPRLNFYNCKGTRGASQVELVVKNPPVNAGDMKDTGLIPGSGRAPGGGHINPLQYSCLENPIDRGAWQAAVHGAAESRT